jgi:hypothetical protein
MYRLAFHDESVSELVLRCYVRADLSEQEPNLAAREATALARHRTVGTSYRRGASPESAGRGQATPASTSASHISSGAPKSAISNDRRRG